MSIKGKAESYVELRGTLSIPEMIQGKSAYEIAVMYGYNGTEEEWLESLHGADGKSAYELAKEGGFEGTEEEFIQLLKDVSNLVTEKLIIGADLNQSANALYMADCRIYPQDGDATIFVPMGWIVRQTRYDINGKSISPIIVTTAKNSDEIVKSTFEGLSEIYIEVNKLGRYNEREDFDKNDCPVTITQKKNRVYDIEKHFVDGSFVIGINSKCYSPGSTASGSDTVAGGKYFDVESYSVETNENGTYYAFKVANYSGLNKDFSALQSVVNEAVSDENQYTNVYVSIRAGYNFDFVGIINDPAHVSAENRTIKLKFDHASISKFNTYLSSNTGNTTLWIPAHPELGSKICEYPAHASGTGSIAQNAAANAEGGHTIASGRYAHTEGVETKAGYSSHAEGKLSKARGDHSHAEGYDTDALGSSAHSEGMKTKGYGDASHSEGIETEAGYGAHSENYRTKAKGSFTHAGGTESIANYTGSFVHGDHLEDCEEYQAIFGKFNKKVPGASFMLGNGTSDSDRKNIMEAYKNGDYRIGALTIGEEIFNKEIKGFATYQSLVSKFDTDLVSYSVYKDSSIFIETYGKWLTYLEELVGVASGTLVNTLPQSNVFYSVDNEAFNIPSELHLILFDADGNAIDCGKVLGFIPIWSWQKTAIVTDKEIPAIEGLGNYTHLIAFAERPDVGEAEMYNKKFPKNKCFAGGEGLFTYNKNESAAGRYNQSRGGMLYSVGNGTDDEHRSNAFAVFEDGHVEVQKQGESENSVVTLGYLLEKINELKALIEGN